MRLTYRILPILLLVEAGLSQGWDLTLTSGEELFRLELLWVKRDSLVVEAHNEPTENPRAIPLNEIDEIRRVTVKRKAKGLVKRAAATVAGGAIGYGVGHFFYRFAVPWLSNGSDADDGSELQNVFVYGSTVVGLMHGKTWPVKGAPDTLVYDLDRMSPAQKMETVKGVVASERPRFWEWIVERGSGLTGINWYEWEVTLTSGQSYTSARLDGLAGDSLRFDVESGRYTVPVTLIQNVRRTFLMGRYIPPVLGGMLGLYGGSVVGRVMSDKILELPPGSPVKPFPIGVGVILGTAAGARYAQRPGVMYDFSGLTDEEKAGAFQMLVLSSP